MIIHHPKVIISPQKCPFFPQKPHLFNIFTLKNDLRTFVEKCQSRIYALIWAKSLRMPGLFLWRRLFSIHPWRDPLRYPVGLILLGIGDGFPNTNTSLILMEHGYSVLYMHAPGAVKCITVSMCDSRQDLYTFL